jgi:hypothetical protein
MKVLERQNGPLAQDQKQTGQQITPARLRLKFLVNHPILRAAAHGAAIHALVAGAATDHDRPAIRAGRRILLI